jgi:hypothetical protein
MFLSSLPPLPKSGELLENHTATESEVADTGPPEKLEETMKMPILWPPTLAFLSRLRPHTLKRKPRRKGREPKLTMSESLGESHPKLITPSRMAAPSSSYNEDPFDLVQNISLKVLLFVFYVCDFSGFFLC